MYCFSCVCGLSTPGKVAPRPLSFGRCVQTTHTIKKIKKNKLNNASFRRKSSSVFQLPCQRRAPNDVHREREQILSSTVTTSSLKITLLKMAVEMECEVAYSSLEQIMIEIKCDKCVPFEVSKQGKQAFSTWCFLCLIMAIMTCLCLKLRLQNPQLTFTKIRFIELRPKMFATTAFVVSSVYPPCVLALDRVREAFCEELHGFGRA